MANYAGHTPLHRQAKIFGRVGADRTVKIMCGWMGQYATARSPYRCLKDFVLSPKWSEPTTLRSKMLHRKLPHQRNWERITSFFAYPREIRKAIYTTNAIESLGQKRSTAQTLSWTRLPSRLRQWSMSLRKTIKMRGSFPTDEAALKLLCLALQNASKKWTMPIQNWSEALNRCAILRPDRMPATERAA